MGVRRFSTLPYAHKPGVATYLNDWSRDLRRRGPRGALVGHLLPRGRASRRTSGSWSTPASRCSRCTCRWGSSTSTTRCSTRCGGLLEDADTPVVVHAGSGPVGNDFTGPGLAAATAAAAPAARRDRGAHGRAGGACGSCAWPRDTRASGWTRRWSSPTFGRLPHWLVPRLVDLSPRSCSAPTSRPSPTPTCASSSGLARLDLGDDWLRAVCWEQRRRAVRARACRRTA